MTLARQLAAHFATTALTSKPPALVHEMKRLMIDWAGIALGGSRADSGRIAGDFVVAVGGAPEANVVGRPERVPAMHAAFANAIAQHSLELDDIDEEALFHYAPPVMSATLATAQLVGASGADVLNAALDGCEMLARLSRATNPELRDRGFHTTPACGTFGAAVAAGRLLGLDAEQLTNALGLAGAQASGPMEMYGTSMQKRFNPGPAARNGIVSAQLARLGFTGADTIFEGERGFGRVFAGKLDPAPLLDGLGEDVPVIVEYKPYSSARPIHNAIDCALEVRDRVVDRLDQIERIRVDRHPAWASYHVINEPRTYHEAQVSLPYSVAVALVDGQALPAQYSDARVQGDEAVRRLSRLVEVAPDPGLLRGVSCHLTVVLRSGETVEATVDYPRGSVQNPLDDGALVAKGRSLAEPVIGGAAFDRVAALVWAFEDAAHVDELFAALSVPAARS